MKRISKSYFLTTFTALFALFSLISILVSAIGVKSEIKSKISTEESKIQANALAFSNYNDVRIDTAESIINSTISDDNVIKYAITEERSYMLDIYSTLRKYANICAKLQITLGIIDVDRNNSITYSDVNHIDIQSMSFPSKIDSTHFTRSDDTILYYLGAPIIKGTVLYKNRIYANDNTLIFFYALRDILDEQFIIDNANSYEIIHNNEIISRLGNQSPEYDAKDIPVGFSKSGKTVFFKQLSKSNPAYSYIYTDNFSIFIVAFVHYIIWLLCLLVISAILSYAISQRLNKPIKSIIQRMTGFAQKPKEQNDLSYIFDTIENVSENLTQLRQDNILSKHQLQQKFMSDLCNGYILDSQINNMIEYFNLDFLNHTHIQICISINNAEEFINSYGADGIPLLKNDIIDLLTPSLPTHCYVDNDNTSIMFFIAGMLTDKVKEHIEHISKYLADKFNIYIVAYVSNTINTPETEKAAYRSISLFRNDRYMPPHHNGIYLTSQNIPIDDKNIYYTHEMEHQLIDYILSNRKSDAFQAIQNIIDINFSRNISKHKLEQMRFAFILTINRFLISLNKKMEEVYPDMSVFDISKTDKYQLYDVFFNMILPLFPLAPKDNADNFDNDYIKISMYIDEHLKDNINLEDLAEYMHYSTSYMSKIFKVTFNQTFKNYVTGRQIDVAKKLLINGVSVNDVAASVGYSSAGSFIRTFKKFTGISPGEFAKQELNEQ